MTTKTRKTITETAALVDELTDLREQIAQERGRTRGSKLYWNLLVVRIRPAAPKARITASGPASTPSPSAAGSTPCGAPSTMGAVSPSPTTGSDWVSYSASPRCWDAPQAEQKFTPSSLRVPQRWQSTSVTVAASPCVRPGAPAQPSVSER